MKLILSLAASVGLVTLLTVTSYGQTPGQVAPPSTAAPAGPAAQTEQMGAHVTVTGCVQKESDWRTAHEKGRGGVAGTGIGVENEYVLIKATISDPAAASAAGATAETAFELTGEKEGDAKAFVGQRATIVGMLKPADTTPSGKPTGGETAGTPPRGIDVTSKDLKLRELEVMTVTKATGTCAALTR